MSNKNTQKDLNRLLEDIGEGVCEKQKCKDYLSSLPTVKGEGNLQDGRTKWKDRKK